MNKLKKYFLRQKSQNEASQQIRTIDRTIAIIDQNFMKTINTQELMENCKNKCPQCQSHQQVIKKYTKLTKLLEVKINKLEKKLSLTNQNNLKSQKQFQKFIMQIKSDSYQQSQHNVQSRFHQDHNTLKCDNLKKVNTSQYFHKTVIKQKKSCLVKGQSKKIIGNVIKGSVAGQKNQEKENISVNSIKNGKQHDQSKELFGISNSPNRKSLGFINLIQKSTREITSCMGILTQISNPTQSQHKPALTPSNPFQPRILALSQTILDLKSFLLHVRHSIFQFVIMSQTDLLRKRDKQDFYMLTVLLNMFQYSEEQVEEMRIKEKRKGPQKTSVVSW